jgi:preprotein translocase subunit SecG
MHTVLIVFHMLLSVGLVGLVLMQHGKGADAGAAFGSGASATVFGARGSANFLSRATAIFAALFFATSLALAWVSMRTTGPSGVMEGLQVEQVVESDANTDTPALPESDLPSAQTPEPTGGQGADSDLPSVPVTE